MARKITLQLAPLLPPRQPVWPKRRMSGSGSGAKAAAGGGRYLPAFSAALAECSAQAQAYGACVKRVLPGVEKGCCTAEFTALQRCFFPVVRRAVRAGGGK